MLRIRQTDQGNTPIVVCDACGERIASAAEGASLYHVFSEEIKQPLGAELFLVHQACRESFEADHGGRRFWLGTALDALPVQLTRALRPRRSPVRRWLDRLGRAERKIALPAPRLLDAMPESHP